MTPVSWTPNLTWLTLCQLPSPTPLWVEDLLFDPLHYYLTMTHLHNYTLQKSSDSTEVAWFCISHGEHTEDADYSTRHWCTTYDISASIQQYHEQTQVHIVKWQTLGIDDVLTKNSSIVVPYTGFPLSFIPEVDSTLSCQWVILDVVMQLGQYKNTIHLSQYILSKKARLYTLSTYSLKQHRYWQGLTEHSLGYYKLHHSIQSSHAWPLKHYVMTQPTWCNTYLTRQPRQHNKSTGLLQSPRR